MDNVCYHIVHQHVHIKITAEAHELRRLSLKKHTEVCVGHQPSAGDMRKVESAVYVKKE